MQNRYPVQEYINMINIMIMLLGHIYDGPCVQSLKIGKFSILQKQTNKKQNKKKKKTKNKNKTKQKKTTHTQTSENKNKTNNKNKTWIFDLKQSGKNLFEFPDPSSSIDPCRCIIGSTSKIMIIKKTLKWHYTWRRLSRSGK